MTKETKLLSFWLAQSSLPKKDLEHETEMQVKTVCDVRSIMACEIGDLEERG